jgi:hypothetical protein
MRPHPRGGRREPDMHAGRGLCTPCYGWADRHNRLADYQPHKRSRDEVLEEWDWLRSDGVPYKHAHQRIGMTPGAFERALQRARAAGDQRARVGAA